MSLVPLFPSSSSPSSSLLLFPPFSSETSFLSAVFEKLGDGEAAGRGFSLDFPLEMDFLFRENSPGSFGGESPAGIIGLEADANSGEARALRAGVLETRVSFPEFTILPLLTGMPELVLPLKLRLPKHENFAALSANPGSPENSVNGAVLFIIGGGELIGVA